MEYHQAKERNSWFCRNRRQASKYRKEDSQGLYYDGAFVSARLTTTCDTDEPTCPGASATKGQGHELTTCSEGTCPPGQNKD